MNEKNAPMPFDLAVAEALELLGAEAADIKEDLDENPPDEGGDDRTERLDLIVRVTAGLENGPEDDAV